MIFVFLRKESIFECNIALDFYSEKKVGLCDQMDLTELYIRKDR